MHVPEIVQEDELNILTETEQMLIKDWNEEELTLFVKENYFTLTVCGEVPSGGYHQPDDYSCGPIAINHFASLLKEIHDSSKDSERQECDDGVLLEKIKTPDELKDNNHHCAAEIFKHLLKKKSKAFSFCDDGKEDGRGSKKSSDGTINNPINLDNTPIQLEIADSEESDYITADEGNNEKGGSDHDANMGSKNDVHRTLKTKNTEFQDAYSEMGSDHMEEQKEKNLDGNSKIHKEKDNNDSKADPEAEGKKSPIYNIGR